MITFKEYISEEIKGWKHAHSDIMKARSVAADASNNVAIHRLKADGGESGLHDARKSFRSEEDAHAHIANIKKLNPGKKINHNLYVNGQLRGQI
jgi:hypothetical protein